MNTFLFFIGSFLVAPSLVSAESDLVAALDRPGTMRDHAIERGLERLERRDYYGVRNNMIRLGHQVRTRRMSPRRIIPGHEGVVTNVIDGSVLVVQLLQGEIVTVRTLGAEAPVLREDIDDTSDTAYCYGEEAAYALSHLTLGKTVTLERDRNYNKDREGRLLRFVRMNSLDINGWMIHAGYSFSDGRNPHSRLTDYHSREEGAREQRRGLWSYKCTYNPKPPKGTISIESDPA